MLANPLGLPKVRNTRRYSLENTTDAQNSGCFSFARIVAIIVHCDHTICNTKRRFEISTEMLIDEFFWSANLAKLTNLEVEINFKNYLQNIQKQKTKNAS